MTGSATAVAVVADDLSGAAETASMFLGRRGELTLNLAADARPTRTGVTVTDLDTRSMSPQDAQRTLRAALDRVPADALLVKKIDSLLRGRVGAEVEVMAERGPVIVVAALPVLNRTVDRGVLHLDGVPLHRTSAWAAEPDAPPRNVAQLFGDHPVANVPAGADVAEAVSKAAANGEIAICDASTDADLDLIVQVGLSVPGAQLVGTAALAAAVARTLPPADSDGVVRSRSERLLTVVGTAEPAAVEQTARLVAAGFASLILDVDELLTGSADPARLASALADGHVVVSIAGPVVPASARRLSASLGRFVAEGQRRHRPDLTLTGGETARAVVDAIGLTTLRPVHEIHHGAVASVASDGRTVVTRPGSFGDAASLITIADHLLSGGPTVHPQQKDI